MKKGISLAVLIITIVVLIILIGISVLNIGSMMVDTDLAKLKMDMAQIQTLMRTYRIINNGDIDFVKTQFDVSGLTQTELLQFSGESIVDDKIELYIIELGKIDAEATNYGMLNNGANDRYLYSDVTKKVYYEKGLMSDNVKYHYIESGE